MRACLRCKLIFCLSLGTEITPFLMNVRFINCYLNAVVWRRVTFVKPYNFLPILRIWFTYLSIIVHIRKSDRIRSGMFVTIPKRLRLIYYVSCKCHANFGNRYTLKDLLPFLFSFLKDRSIIAFGGIESSPLANETGRSSSNKVVIKINWFLFRDLTVSDPIIRPISHSPISRGFLNYQCEQEQVSVQ